ncbi:MAG: family 78 glycoside hydrolase catalytic domain [Oscillospiraceae bacterium]|nr:family 78 glycoside hydrolase catalytic domain [Oscillospiraceae bacterium]
MDLCGKWITGKEKVDIDSQLPPYLFRKKVTWERDFERAVVYATALGCYNILFDGELISERYFAPGYTQYNKRLLYQTYDVTEKLKGKKETEILAEVTGGWYAGRLGLCLKGNRYGEKRAFLMELHLIYPGGEEEILKTDETWSVTADGPRRFADFFDGEIYDARVDLASARWEKAALYKGELPPLIEPDDGVPVLRHDSLKPRRVWKGAEGDTLIDFGRNIAGIVELGPFQGKAGRKVTIRHGELVQNDKLVTENLRTAKATLEYICRDGIQTYAPCFTYMGFQFVSVTGMEVREDEITAWEVYSDIKPIGSFQCSDERINQLQKNICTSLKANFVDIPTDCPQRDERCGWTGDIAVFAPTAAFNMDITKFMKKWLRDLGLGQRKNGAMPLIAPTNLLGDVKGDGLFGWIGKQSDAVWGDAVILVPWAVYQSTGDEEVLASMYEHMVEWMRYCSDMAAKFSLGEKRLIRNFGFSYGDWLAPGESMAANMKKSKWTSTAWLANSARLMSRIAGILGKKGDAAKYDTLYKNIRNAFQKTFVNKEGHIKHGFQSIWALALQFDLLTQEQAALAKEDLIADIRARGNHLATGFVGTDQLPYALSDHGAEDVAFDLLMQVTCPSWLYPVTCGATSIWERWDSLRPDGTVNTDGVGEGNMVSFNHYAYGSIGNWLYTRVGGLEMLEPGYRRFRIKPLMGGGISWAKTTHSCPYGDISVFWKLEDTVFSLEALIPEGTMAEVFLPDGTSKKCGPGMFELKCTLGEKRNNDQIS